MLNSLFLETFNQQQKRHIRRTRSLLEGSSIDYRPVVTAVAYSRYTSYSIAVTLLSHGTRSA
jgi:hypothetical protein